MIVHRRQPYMVAHYIVFQCKVRLTLAATFYINGKQALHLDMPPSIVNRVKELRTTRGWTQEQLADAVGVSRQSINSIERDRYVPSLPLALTFARVFGCPTDEIFSLSQNPNADARDKEIEQW
jgi:putative transcriptional regulator